MNSFTCPRGVQMSVPFQLAIPGFCDVYVESDGVIRIEADGDYNGYKPERHFTIAEMREIVAYAARHAKAYRAYEVDYNEADYFETFADGNLYNK